jgi:hypothetical protein
MSEKAIRFVLEMYLSHDFIEVIMAEIKVVEEGESDDVDG